MEIREKPMIRPYYHYKILTKMSTQTNTKQVENAKKPEIIEVSAIEVKQGKTVEEFILKLEKANQLSTLRSKYLTRLKEIRDFKNVIADGGSIQLYVEHVSGKQIEFPHVKIVNDFINMQLDNGEKELVELENQIKQFTL
jgi:hypothetical protein